jgi:hypothetical protein
MTMASEPKNRPDLVNSWTASVRRHPAGAAVLLAAAIVGGIAAAAKSADQIDASYRRFFPSTKILHDTIDVFYAPG